MWNPDVPDVEPEVIKAREPIDIDALNDGRCKASTWGPSRAKLPAKPTYENYFGPGGFNRCIGPEDHSNPRHKDEWGHVFELTAAGCHVVRREDPVTP
jgi:hypothetical protein